MSKGKRVMRVITIGIQSNGYPLWLGGEVSLEELNRIIKLCEAIKKGRMVVRKGESEMKVETYEVTELTTGGEEKVEEAKELIEQLNLEGQKELIKGEKVFPYRKMTKQERVVYKAICPEVTPVNKFSDSIIPVRVLQVIAHVKEFDFITIEVWHQPNADIKDPILVGRKGDTWRTDVEYYLLARWGEELQPFEVLFERAVKVLTAKVRAQALSAKREIEGMLTGTEEMVRGRLMEGNTPHLSLYTN